MNKYSVSITVIAFILYSTTSIMASLITRWDPGFHAEYDYPISYDAILIILIVFAIGLMVGFFFNAFKIFRNWNQLIQRHKIFFYLSFYFFFAFFLITVTGFY